DRPDVAERPAALVGRMLRVLDVADDRIDVGVAQLPLREARHQIWTDSHGLGDLHRAGVLERRNERTGYVPALGVDLVTAAAVLREQLESIRDVAALRMRRRDRRTAERRDVRDEIAQLALAEEHTAAVRL